MKTCQHCNGTLYRHGTYKQGQSQRYRCKSCGKTITVRNGEIVTHGGARVKDWRMGNVELSGAAASSPRPTQTQG